MGNYTHDSLERKIKDLSFWFQNFDIDGIFTNAEYPEYPNTRWQLIEPTLPKSLVGKTVLDLGCNAGWFSIKMKQLGAEYVLGIDVCPNAIEQAKFVSDYFGVSVEYRCMNIYEFVLKNTLQFDYVMFLGLFYHLRYPLLVLDKMGEVTKERMYFQTITLEASLSEGEKGVQVLPDYNFGEWTIFDSPNYPKMFFIEEMYNHDPTNWWFANRSCVHAMLRSAGFKNTTELGTHVFMCEPCGLDFFI